MATAKYTFAQFKEQYPDDDACLLAVFRRKFGKHTDCPGCGVADSKFHRIAGRRAFACQWCGHHVYPCAGTEFEHSSTPLTLWFHAMYLMTATRNGVSGKELQRQLGVTYKCAWRIGHQLRLLMAKRAKAENPDQLSGHVEIDETFAPTPLAEKILSPVYAEDAKKGLVDAFFNIDLFKTIYSDFHGKELPPEAGLKNALRNRYHVLESGVDIAYRTLMESAETAGFFDARNGARTHLIIPSAYSQAGRGAASLVPPATDPASAVWWRWERWRRRGAASTSAATTCCWIRGSKGTVR